jgi:plasmid maintenance system antidote protein VapI
LRLARFFGGDAQSWLNLQQAYALKITEREVAATIEREVRALAYAAWSGELALVLVLVEDRRDFI